jgi:hypothetical protein
VVVTAGTQERVQEIVARRSAGDAEVRLATGLEAYKARLDTDARGDPRYRRAIDRVVRDLGQERVVAFTPARLERQARAWKARGTGPNGATLLLGLVKRGCRFAGVSVVPDIPVAEIIRRVYGTRPGRPRMSARQPRGRFGRFVRREG